MTFIAKVFGLSLLVFGCATGGGARPFGAAEAGRSRSMEIEGSAARSVVSGPSTIHAYSSHDGASLFTAAAMTGTDRDCQRSVSSSALAETRVQADRVVTFNVPAGRIACVEGTSAGVHELIWHQTDQPSGAGSFLATSSN
jgi:hypothetical protein